MAETVKAVLAQYAELERTVYEALAQAAGGPHGAAVAGVHEAGEQLLELARAYAEHPRLGLATTGNLLAEVAARIDVDYTHGGGGLGYSTVSGRPTLTEAAHAPCPDCFTVHPSDLTDPGQ